MVMRAHVHAVVDAPGVFDEPVVLAALRAVADHHDGMVYGCLAAGRVKNAALVGVPVLQTHAEELLNLEL